MIGRRGTTAWTLTVTGKPAHSSQIFRPDIGYGAIFEAARILNAFRETLGRRAAPDVQSRARARRHAGASSTPCRRAARRSARTTSSPNTRSSRATCERCRTSSSRSAREAHGGDRRPRRRSRRRGRRLPSTRAIRRSRRPMAIAQLLALYDQASRDVGAGPVTAVDPDRAGRRRRVVRRRPRADDPRRHRPDGRRRPHRQARRPT